MNEDLEILPIKSADKDWISPFLNSRWGSHLIVSRGVNYDGTRLPGFICWSSGDRVGLVTYHIADRQCEIVSLDSLKEGRGIGSLLIKSVQERALESGCNRLWLITTNDNLPALRFYQKRGFRLVAVHRDAIQTSRQLKPEIPKIGLFGIPLRDEIELEIILSNE